MPRQQAPDTFRVKAKLVFEMSRKSETDKATIEKFEGSKKMPNKTENTT